MQTNEGVIKVSEEVYRKLPGVMLITGLAKVSPQNINKEKIKEYLQGSWENLKNKVLDESSAESVRIQQWCDALKDAGVKIKDYPPSIKAIAKRALKGGEPFSINPIVDAYNAISMDLALPFGAYSKTDLNGNLQIRLSNGGESFIGLGSSENDPTAAEEIVFSDNENILTRMFLWRQSNKSKINEQTSEFIFICEVCGSMGREMAEKAKALIEQKLIELLGAEISNLQIQTE